MRLLLLALLTVALFVSAGCATTTPVRKDPLPTASPKAAKTRVESGIASYYSDVLHGRLTASGQRYDKSAATCAHRTHRFGTRLEVVVLDTGRKAQCRVNDRGPFVDGRIVDVSRSIAEKLGLLDRGLARVEIRQVGD